MVCPVRRNARIAATHLGGCQLNVGGAAPGLAAVDHLALLGGVDRLGEGVVIAIAT